MQIKTTKKDILWNYVGTAFSMVGNFLLLPFLVLFLSDEMLGLWYVYIAVGNLVTLFEFGFNPTFARNFAFCWSGADRLMKEGRAFSGAGRSIDSSLLAHLLGACRMVYKRITLVALFVLLVPGTLYIASVSGSLNVFEVYLSWTVFACAVLFNLYYLYYAAMLRGIGSIDTGLRFYGVRLLDEGFGADVASETLVVDTSWLDATGTDAGVVCNRGSLVAAHFATPAGGAFGAASVVDADGSVAPHVVIEPDDAVGPAGETVIPGGEVPGDGTGEPTGGADPAAGQPGAGPTTNPAVKPAIATKTTTTTAVTKTTVAKTSNPKSATATSSSLPKTADSHWIAISPVLFLLGMALLSAAHRC